MSSGFFKDIGKIKYEGQDSTNPPACRFYNPHEVMAGMRFIEAAASSKAGNVWTKIA